jgi:hypothetical protein
MPKKDLKIFVEGALMKFYYYYCMIFGDYESFCALINVRWPSPPKIIHIFTDVMRYGHTKLMRYANSVIVDIFRHNYFKEKNL